MFLIVGEGIGWLLFPDSFPHRLSCEGTEQGQDTASLCCRRHLMENGNCGQMPTSNGWQLEEEGKKSE